MTLYLKELTPFAQGGNRQCFVHPDNPNRCIKVRRPDFTLEDCRRKKGFPKNLKPLSSFDDNLEEFKVITNLHKMIGGDLFGHIYQCFGFVETDLGAGLETELVLDDDGRISLSLKQYIWEYGYSDACKKAVADLIGFWEHNLIPSRDILTHNVLVQQGAHQDIKRLVVIDGLGSASAIPFQIFPTFVKKRAVSNKVERFKYRIDEFVAKCESGKAPSKVGMLNYR